MKRLNTETFILESKLIHGDKYDYSLVEYTRSDIEILILNFLKKLDTDV